MVEKKFDLIIKNGWIIDGLGNPKFKSDIGIKEETILEIGTLPENEGNTIIDAEGLCVCPGFIDPHAHFDLTIEMFPECENGIIQGITTFVGGNCGMSSILTPPDKFNFPEFLSRLEKLGIGINFAPLIGHGYIRGNVMGDDYKRIATSSEIEKMKVLTENAMKEGAFGISTGLDYNPTMHSNTHEIIELVKVVQNYGGIYATHHRYLQSKWPTDDITKTDYCNYPGDVDEVWFGRYHGLMEAIEIGRQTKIPIQISHLYNVYRIPQPHPDFLEVAAAKATLALIDQAVEGGVDVTFDRMVTFREIQGAKPIINDFLKVDNGNLNFLKEMGQELFLQRLVDPDFRTQLKTLSKEGKLKILYSNTRADPFWMNRMIIIHCKDPHFIDKNIGDLARKDNKDALDVIFDLILLDDQVEYQQILDEKEMTESALPIFLTHPRCMPCSDLIDYPPLKTPISEMAQVIRDNVIQNINSPHTYNMYPYFFGTFIREKKIMPLEEAIRKSTSQVAQRFGIEKRGEIKENNFADLVIFDFNSIGMVATYKNPRQAPQGIKYVVLNGQVAMQENQQSHKKYGKVLHKL